MLELIEIFECMLLNLELMVTHRYGQVYMPVALEDACAYSESHVSPKYYVLGALGLFRCALPCSCGVVDSGPGYLN